MDAEWISAAEAFAFAKRKMNYFLATRAICCQANDGLISARAKLLIRGSERLTDCIVPQEFWWARGEAALDARWQTSDFETESYPESRYSRDREVWKAYRVEFLTRDIEGLVGEPYSANQNAADTKSNGGPGRRKEHDWEGALLYLIGQAELHGIAQTPDAHGMQSDIANMIGDWFGKNSSKVPVSSQLQAMAKRVLTAIKTANS